MLHRDEETRLGDRARRGDVDARDRLAVENLGLARMVAYRQRRRFPGEVDDLFQDGCIGLLEAAATFDGSRAKFATHGSWKARGRISRTVDAIDRRQRFEVLSGDLASERHPDPDAELQDAEPGPVERAERAEYEATMLAAFAQLPEREQAVLKDRYWRGLTLQEVGREMGVTKERVRQLEYRALERLRALLTVQ